MLGRLLFGQPFEESVTQHAFVTAKLKWTVFAR